MKFPSPRFNFEIKHVQFQEGGEELHMPVLFSDTILNLRDGTTAVERREIRPKNYRQKIKKLQQLNRRHSIKLNAGPERFNEKLSEIATLHFDETLTLSISGLNRLEGKGSQKKIFQLLVYCALLPEEYKFIIDILLEKLVGRYYNRKKENLGTIGEETLQLLKVFGRYEVRLRYLQERYSDIKLRDNAKRGEEIFNTLYIRFFDSSPIQLCQRKRGYNDHGSLRQIHEFHGNPSVKGDETMSRKEVSEILLEIYKESTSNYLDWLKRQAEEKNESQNNQENVDPNHNSKEEDQDESSKRNQGRTTQSSEKPTTRKNL